MPTKTWNGSSADWNTAGDWSPTGVPGPTDDVVINSGQPELVSGDAPINVKSISLTGGFLTIEEAGKTQSVSGNVSITGGAAVSLDGPDLLFGGGGSSLKIGGTLTNSSTNGNGLDIGNTGITSADTVTVNGAGGLINGSSSEINIEGSASVRATLNVANAAAGFGSGKGVETGTVFLENDALLEFKTGSITTINGNLTLDGASADVADAGKLTSNSALTGLTSVTDIFRLENGAKVTTTSNLSITGNAIVSLDGPDLIFGGGGTSLTIGGKLTNNSTNGNGLNIGNTGLVSADTLTVNGAGGLFNGTTSEINIEGSASVRATLNVANAAAGFGTKGVETGTVILENDALLEFKTGSITTINGNLTLDGASAHVADAGATTSNSALTGLTSVTDIFRLENGAKVATKGNLSIIANGLVSLDGPDFVFGGGGTSVTIGGKLTNNSTNGNGLDVGNTGLVSADTLTVNGTGGLINGATSEINIEGSASVRATLNVANAAAGFGSGKGVETGTVFLENDALLEFKTGSITTINGNLTLNGASAHVADAGKLTSNSALTGLTSVTDIFRLENGAKVTTTSNLSITGNAIVSLDGPDLIFGGGGTSLTIGGKLTNNSTNGNGLDVGNTGLVSADTLTVNGTGGLINGATSEINIEGSASVRATLNVANAAAGFGSGKGVETGTVFLENDALLEFKTGSITTINGNLTLNGASAHVADAGATTSNSALTGLTSVTDIFRLENGAKVATKGNLSITGNGIVSLDGPDVIFGGGGSSLTIGGTLTNSSTNGNALDVGNTGLASGDTLTVRGAGGLSNTGDINIEGGSVSAQGKLVVTSAVASSAGTISLNSFGDLTASAVNMTGGTLLGFGTVTGALHVTGGTVLGGNFDSTPGTLTVSGAYSQSGNGTLQADINTGFAQQSSTVKVTGSPGTPGAPGSVNLAGGTLLIEGESSLAVGTLYTVMSFGPNHLYGEFKQVQTEGSLGNFIGNRTSVNVGNNETLEVLYNEASGTVQVELVATPSKTTYQWNIGSGTWNISSAKDWNPPGNGTTPSANSNVTIGTGSGGTVTLAQDQTINSLSITKGYTLSGAKNSITTNAGVSVASGGALSLHSMNVGGVFTDSGSVTLAGVLTINKGGGLTLSNGSFTGGINGSGTFQTNTTGTLKDVTIFGGTTFTASNNATTDISGTIGGRGTLQVNGGGGTNGILALTGATTLTGGGTVSLTTTKGGDSALIEGAGQTLTNATDTIQGTGTIGAGSLALSNGGTIDANISAGTLLLNGTGGITNTNVFEATSGGILDVAGAITGKGGTLQIGAGSEVELGGATSQASTFLASSGKLSIDNATKTTYSGVINSFVKGDVLELGSTNATSATPTKNGVDTTLTVDLSSGGPLTFTLAGNLTGDTFSVTHVGGNSDIAIATPAAFGEAHSLLRDPIRSSFIGSSDVMGGYNSTSAQLNLAAWNNTGHGPGGAA